MIPVGILFKKVTEYRCSRTVKVDVMVWIDGENAMMKCVSRRNLISNNHRVSFA